MMIFYASVQLWGYSIKKYIPDWYAISHQLQTKIEMYLFLLHINHLQSTDSSNIQVKLETMEIVTRFLIKAYITGKTFKPRTYIRIA